VLDVPYNILRQSEFDGDLRLVASAQGIAVTPSQALEHGYLAGVHRDRAQVAYSVRGIQLAAAMNRRGSRTLRALDRIGDELSVPPSAVAIAWLLAQRAVVAPIVNVFAVAHVEELVQGVGARLSRSTWARSRAPRSRGGAASGQDPGRRRPPDVGWELPHPRRDEYDVTHYLYLVRHGEHLDAEHGLEDGPLSPRGTPGGASRRPPLRRAVGCRVALAPGARGRDGSRRVGRLPR
jgi:hypothetical protein